MVALRNPHGCRFAVDCDCCLAFRSGRMDHCPSCRHRHSHALLYGVQGTTIGWECRCSIVLYRCPKPLSARHRVESLSHSPLFQKRTAAGVGCPWIFAVFMDNHHVPGRGERFGGYGRRSGFRSSDSPNCSRQAGCCWTGADLGVADPHSPSGCRADGVGSPKNGTCDFHSGCCYRAPGVEYGAVDPQSRSNGLSESKSGQ